MALSTTQSIWRSGGGDNSRTAYCGTGLMVAEFSFPATQVSGNAKVSSAANAANLILPANAVIVQINANAAGTGGSTPTFDMGFTTYSSNVASPQALLNESDADAGKQIFDWASATAGASLNVVMSATELVYITGRAGASAATGGTISGEILYYVTDPLLGQQND